jgi:hypothetical protein
MKQEKQQSSLHFLDADALKISQNTFTFFSWKLIYLEVIGYGKIACKLMKSRSIQ